MTTWYHDPGLPHLSTPPCHRCRLTLLLPCQLRNAQPPWVTTAPRMPPSRPCSTPSTRRSSRCRPPLRQTPRRSSAWMCCNLLQRRPRRQVCLRGAPSRPAPTVQKLDFRQFDGKSNPLAFIIHCDSYFYQRSGLVQPRRPDSMCYIQIWQDDGAPSWQSFTKHFHLRYGPPLRSNPHGELTPYKHFVSIVEY